MRVVVEGRRQLHGKGCGGGGVVGVGGGGGGCVEWGGWVDPRGCDERLRLRVRSLSGVCLAARQVHMHALLSCMRSRCFALREASRGQLPTLRDSVTPLPPVTLGRPTTGVWQGDSQALALITLPREKHYSGPRSPFESLPQPTRHSLGALWGVRPALQTRTVLAYSCTARFLKPLLCQTLENHRHTTNSSCTNLRRSASCTRCERSLSVPLGQCPSRLLIQLELSLVAATAPVCGALGSSPLLAMDAHPLHHSVALGALSFSRRSAEHCLLDRTFLVSVSPDPVAPV